MWRELIRAGQVVLDGSIQQFPSLLARQPSLEQERQMGDNAGQEWIAIIYVMRMEARRIRDDIIEPPKEELDGWLDGMKDKQEYKGRGRKARRENGICTGFEGKGNGGCRVFERRACMHFAQSVWIEPDPLKIGTEVRMLE